MNSQVYVATTDAEENELMCFVIKLNLKFIEHAKKMCCLWLNTECSKGLTLISANPVFSSLLTSYSDNQNMDTHIYILAHHYTDTQNQINSMIGHRRAQLQQ